jgi:hypothetical protein
MMTAPLQMLLLHSRLAPLVLAAAAGVKMVRTVVLLQLRRPARSLLSLRASDRQPAAPLPAAAAASWPP